MQNTIVREFEGNSEVVTLILDQGGSNGETRPWLETFWTNYYLRGGVLWDETGAVGAAYSQPNTGLPFGRGFIIDRDGAVALPYFGHQPQMAIDFIHAMLGESGAVGDDPGASSASTPSSGGEACRILSLHPNPSPGLTTLSFDALRAGRFSGSLYDAMGRRRGGFALDVPAPGRGVRTLALGDEAGAALESGIYFLRLEEGAGTGVRVLIVR